MRIQVFITYMIFVLLSCSQNDQAEKQKSNEEPHNKEISPSIEENDLQEDKNMICEYDNQVSTLGIGMIIAPEDFEIFEDSLLSKKYGAYNVYEDANEIDFCSKFFSTDYGILHFICLKNASESYKVLVNYSDTLFMEKKESNQFFTWEEYILSAYGIRRKETGGNSPKQPIQEKPNENSELISIPDGYENFCPMELEGDWVKVQYDCFYNDENNSFEGQPCDNYIDKCEEPLIGWLKWKEENELKIDIFLRP